MPENETRPAQGGPAGSPRAGRAIVTRREAVAAALGGGLVVALSGATAHSSEAYTPSHAHDQPNAPSLHLEYRSPALTPFVDPLPVPPRRGPGGRITVAAARHQFHRDLAPTTSWGYDGLSHLGPTIEVRRGDRSVTTFVNQLGPHAMAGDIDVRLHGASELDRTQPPTVVHLHGAPNPPAGDGHPMAMFRPGQSVDYAFNNDLPACGLWYHDHAMGTTRLGVYAGLASHYWIRDEWDDGTPANRLGLPAGQYEIPLTICDKLFTADGALTYQGSPTVARDHWGGGLAGDVMVVNGKAWPYLEVDRGVYRFRVVNGSQLNEYRLRMSNGMAFWVIGSDGGLLDQPVRVLELDVGNGERYDVLVDFGDLTPGESVDLVNTMPIAWSGQLIGAVQVPRVMRFVVGSAPGRHRQVPTVLRGRPGLPPALPPPAEPQSTRTASLNSWADFSKAEWISTLTMSINNLRFTDPGYDLPRQGTVERWDLVNGRRDRAGALHAPAPRPVPGRAPLRHRPGGVVPGPATTGHG